MTAAALGTTLTLPTLEADVEQGADSGVETEFELEIRPGTQSGTEQVLRGRGVPGLRGGRGDLVVTVVVETPARLDPRQEELLRELAALRGEESPTGQVKPSSKSVFGRLRDAFNARTDVSARPPRAVAGRCRRRLGGHGRGGRGAPRRRRPAAEGGGVRRADGRSRYVGGRRGRLDRQAGVLPRRRDGVVGARTGPGARRRPGPAEGGPGRAGRRGADRGRRRHDRPLGGRPQRRRLEGRAGRRSPCPAGVPRHARQPSRRVVRGSRRWCRWSPRPRSWTWSPAPIWPSCCTRRPRSSLASLSVPGTGRIVVVVGPEGGLTDDEVAAFVAVGAQSVRLGAEVLRTSTAGVAAVSALLSRTPRWG